MFFAINKINSRGVENDINPYKNDMRGGDNR